MEELLNAVTKVYDNPEGFGPGKTIDPTFSNQLFQPYYKTSDRAFNVSDWSSKPKGRASAGIVSGFAYKVEDDASSFSVVEKAPRPQFKRFTARTPLGKNNQNQNRTVTQKKQQQQQQQGTYQTNNRTTRNNTGNYNNNRNNNRNNNNKRPTGGFGRFRSIFREEFQREASVHVSTEWNLTEEIEFEELKQSINVPEVTELRTVGTLEKYNEFYDRTTVKSTRNLLTTPISTFTVTASADENMKEFAAKGLGNVFATENVLSLLMSTVHTVQPWDILVTKTENGIFLDSRPDSVANKRYVQETVSEFLPADADHINNVENLARESTSICNYFTQQIVSIGEAPIQGDKASPVPADAPNRSATVYRYRKFDLGDGIQLVARTSIAAYKGDASNPTLMSVKVFNEFDSKCINGNIDWRESLDTQSSTVLAAEMKNNTCRVVRAAAETYLNGADVVKLGWVTRASPKDNTRHTIIGVTTFDTQAFTTSVRIPRTQLWGTLKTILDFVCEQEEGKYILLRDPMRANLKIYEVDDSTFDPVVGVINVSL